MKPVHSRTAACSCRTRSSGGRGADSNTYTNKNKGRRPGINPVFRNQHREWNLYVAFKWLPCKIQPRTVPVH